LSRISVANLQFSNQNSTARECLPISAQSCKGNLWHGSAFADRFGAAEGFRCCLLEAAFLQAIFQYRESERDDKIRWFFPALKISFRGSRG